jgi:hypothetical protein
MHALYSLGIMLAFLVARPAPAHGAPALSAQATAAASSLRIDGLASGSTRIVKIGVVSLSTTGPEGFTLSVSSGSLNKSDGTTPLGFQVVLVDRDATAPSSAAFTTPSGMTYFFATSSAVTVDKDLYIKYRPAALQDPGAYTASIELGIVDN